MAKFHINQKGVPSRCRAKKGNCPFGGADSHFNSIEDAQKYSEKENSSNFGIIAEIKENNTSMSSTTLSLEVEKRTSRFEDLQTVEEKKKAVFDDYVENHLQENIRKFIEDKDKIRGVSYMNSDFEVGISSEDVEKIISNPEEYKRNLSEEVFIEVLPYVEKEDGALFKNTGEELDLAIDSFKKKVMNSKKVEQKYINFEKLYGKDEAEKAQSEFISDIKNPELIKNIYYDNSVGKHVEIYDRNSSK